MNLVMDLTFIQLQINGKCNFLLGNGILKQTLQVNYAREIDSSPSYESISNSDNVHSNTSSTDQLLLLPSSSSTHPPLGEINP